MASTSTVSTLVGIDNQQEFFSDHYLVEILANDIQGTLRRWAERASSAEESDLPPDAGLKALWKPYREFRESFGRQDSDVARVSLQRTWFRRLLKVLGYGWDARNLPLENGGGGDSCPERRRSSGRPATCRAGGVRPDGIRPRG